MVGCVVDVAQHVVEHGVEVGVDNCGIAVGGIFGKFVAECFFLFGVEEWFDRRFAGEPSKPESQSHGHGGDGDAKRVH